MSLSIVVLNYKTKDLTTACIKSLVEQYGKQMVAGEVEIIIIDNASGDGSAEIIKKAFADQKNIFVLENKENLGFGKGCNEGAKKARGNYILFLNSDTKTQDNNFLKMVKFLENNENVGILGGRLLNLDGSRQKSVGIFYTLPFFILMILGFEKLGFLRSSPMKAKKVDWVSGACMMVRKSTFDSLGGFDKHIFMYIEDMELCYRFKNSGYATYFFPHISVTHQEFGSSNRAFAVINIYKGLLYFYKIHRSKWEYQTVKILLLSKAKLAILAGKITGNSYLVNTYREAMRF